MAVPAQPDASEIATAVRDAIDLRRFPWIRPLVTAFAADFPSVAPLFAGNPADPAAWRETIARVQRGARDRNAIADILARQLKARSAPPAAHAAAERLREPATVAVVTGQQAGLFGGPLYTLLKAATAIQLARRIEAEHHVAAVPVFWVDAEDHDWDEIKSAKVLDRDFALHQIALADVVGAGTQPVAALTLDEGAGDALAELAAALAPSEFTRETLDALTRRYAAGTPVATAFAGWLDDLLGRHGMVVFDAADPAAKPLAADIFARELQNPCRTAKLARDGGALMRQLGHAPQVEPAEDGVALFYLDAAGRRPIKRKDDTLIVGDDVHDAAALRAEAAAEPRRFSPNVLLRPLVQDRLFPTVCYVAGPSELAYQAQLGGIYKEFGVETPLLYSRVSATLLDSASARFIERHHVALESLLPQDEAALNKLLEDQLPPALERALAETAAQVDAQAERMKDAVRSLDPTLTGTVDTTVKRMREALNGLQGKIIQASKRKDDTLRRQFTRTRMLAFPGGAPQERTLNVAFFTNRYGLTIVDRLLEALPLETDKHYVVTL